MLTNTTESVTADGQPHRRTAARAANLSDKPGPPHQIKRKNDDENHNRNNTRAVDVHSRVRG